VVPLSPQAAAPKAAAKSARHALGMDARRNVIGRTSALNESSRKGRSRIFV
jgi:hypothetical protein